MEMPKWLKPGAHVKADGANDDYIGEIVALLPGRMVSLRNASWVSESGRLHEFVRDGRAGGMELEPVGEIVHHYETITHWPHPLPTEAV